jgi:type II secretion system protein H
LDNLKVIITRISIKQANEANGAASRPRRAGFTLIELILVMAVIVVMAAVVTPRMADFFRGRALDNEARRFMTLTRYGQNRAVSEGVPMLVWIDEEKRRYGLEAQPGYLERDDKAVEYNLAENLEIEVGNALTAYGTASAQLVSRTLPANVRFIRFGPDGFLSEASPEYVLIRRNETDALAIGPGRNWQQYEIYTNNAYALLR